MARHRLSIEDQIRGLEKGIRSRRTPEWLKPGMKKFLKKLRRKVRGIAFARPKPLPLQLN
jgi:hypothetical protein